MVEYIRGIKAGLASGLISGLIYSIVALFLAYLLLSPLQSVTIDGLQDDDFNQQFNQMVIILSVSKMFMIGISLGLVLGVVVAVAISRIRLKQRSVILLMSILLNYLLFLLPAIPFMILIGKGSIYLAFAAVVITISALVEGVLLNYFWGKFKNDLPSIKNTTPAQIHTGKIGFVSGIKAGVISGIITAVIFSIVAAVIISHYREPLSLISQGAVHSDPLDNMNILWIIIYSSLTLTIRGICNGVIIGVIVAAIVSRINVKLIYLAPLMSILFFLVTLFMPLLNFFISFYDLFGGISSLSVIFTILFALSEGILISYFWIKFTNKPNSTSSLPLHDSEHLD